MRCPFCGAEMEPGSVRIGGMGLYPSICSLFWAPMNAPRRLTRLLAGRQEMTASLCGACAAVVMPPGASTADDVRRASRPRLAIWGLSIGFAVFILLARLVEIAT